MSLPQWAVVFTTGSGLPKTITEVVYAEDRDVAIAYAARNLKIGSTRITQVVCAGRIIQEGKA